MSTTTHAPRQIDPSASLHAESLGIAKSHGRLAGRRIIVVGAGQRKIIDEEPPIGNGRAMAVLFAREGASVACIDINQDAADNTVAQITAEGGKAFADIVDVSDAAAIAPAVERCARHLGGLDGLALGMINYLNDFPAIRDELLPRMERAGLREARAQSEIESLTRASS